MRARRKQLTPEQRELVKDAHQEAMGQGASTYIDPISGARIFTAAHHLERGYCCDCACRHCPFPKAGRILSGAR